MSDLYRALRGVCIGPERHLMPDDKPVELDPSTARFLVGIGAVELVPPEPAPAEPPAAPPAPPEELDAPPAPAPEPEPAPEPAPAAPETPPPAKKSGKKE